MRRAVNQRATCSNLTGVWGAKPERSIGEQLLSHFYRSVTSLVRNTSGLEDAYRAMLIVQQARLSHAEGRRITLDLR